MSCFFLKMVALITMSIDHLTEVFEWSRDFRFIGRMAFPIYALLLTETIQYIRQNQEKRRKYLLALLILALLSELPYDFAFHGGWLVWEEGNQVLQFFLYALCVFASDPLPLWGKVILYSLLGAVCCVGSIGYGASGILFLMLLQLYSAKKKELPQEKRAVGVLLIVAVLFLALALESVSYYPDLIARYGVLRVLRAVWISYTGDMIFYGVFLSVPLMAALKDVYAKGPYLLEKLYHYYYPLHLWLLTIAVLLRR